MNIVLVGNANVGKSVIFNSLTGSYVTVSNYPGTTVDISKGHVKLGAHKFSVIDTPGVSSLTPHSEDEKVTKDILSKSDIACIVQVADAKNLKRSLALTLELIALGIPMILALNMSDEAGERGIKINLKKLSQKLGIDVIETVAITGQGVLKLRESILTVKEPVPEASLAAKLAGLTGKDQISLLKRRNILADGITRECADISYPINKDISEVIGRFTIRPFTGIPILILVMLAMYLFVGKFAAGTAVNFLEEKIFGEYINPFCSNIIYKYIPFNIVRDFLVGNYGIITMAVTYAFAIIFPIVTAFFLFFGILEDSGYLPRLAVLSDRLFRSIGLNGRAILPMMLGLGCGTMATLTTRILDTKKERILVNLLLALVVPCSAQLGVIMGMLGAVSMKALFIWFFILLFIMVTVGYISSKIVPGTRSPFIQEVPPMRMPQLSNIVVKTAARLKWYLKEAVPLFILGTAILFAADKTGILKWIEYILSPLVVTLLGLPSKATEAFIIGFLRRDYGAAGLYALSKGGLLDNIQVLVSTIVITLFVPCIAQFMVTIKERGVKTASIILVFVSTFAFLAGGALNFLLRYLVYIGIKPI